MKNLIVDFLINDTRNNKKQALIYIGAREFW